MHKQQGWPQAWEYCQAKPIQTLGRTSQGVNWSWSQCIKSHHAQTSSGKPSHIWNRNIIRSILAGLRRKRTGLLLSGSKSSFQINVHFAFHLEIKVPESGGRVEKNPSCLKSSVKFPQSVMIWGAVTSAGVGPLCFIKSKVNAAIYQEILEHFMLPSADKLYGDADFIFQHLPTVLKPLPSGLLTMILVFDWSANTADLNNIWNLWYIFKRNSWSNNTIKGSIVPQQCHRLIAFMPQLSDSLICAKGALTKWECINEHTLKNFNFFVLQIIFFFFISGNILIFWDTGFFTFMRCKL